MGQALSIAGGGLAGLACAIRLQEKGWQVSVHERQRYPLKKVCGEFLSPEGWRRVQALGAGAFIGLQPWPLRRARFYANAAAFVDFPMQPEAFGISRGVLDQALALRFKALGGALHEGSSLDPATPGVVDATGRPTAEGTGAWMGWKAYLPSDRAPVELADADLLMLPLAAGYAGLSRIEDGRVSLCLVARAPVQIPALLANHPVLARCASDLQPHAAIARFDFTVQGGARTIGDARRVFPPLVGDGMTQALRAGEALAGRLAAGGKVLSQDGAFRFHGAKALHSLMLWAPGREALVGLCLRWPGLAQGLYRWSRG